MTKNLRMTVTSISYGPLSRFINDTLKSFCAVYTERTSEPCSLESEPVIKFPVKLSTYVIP